MESGVIDLCTAALEHFEYPSGGAFNYPQVVAAEIRFGASGLLGLNPM
jgi:hypothetical protein